MYLGAGALAIIYHTNPASVYKQYYILYDQVFHMYIHFFNPTKHL